MSEIVNSEIIYFDEQGRAYGVDTASAVVLGYYTKPMNKHKFNNHISVKSEHVDT